MNSLRKVITENNSFLLMVILPHVRFFLKITILVVLSEYQSKKKKKTTTKIIFKKLPKPIVLYQFRCAISVSSTNNLLKYLLQPCI